MQTLTNYERKELIEQNEARREAGLRQIEVKIRPCLQCGENFESAGKRRCKPCLSASAAYPSLSGHDIVGASLPRGMVKDSKSGEE